MIRATFAEIMAIASDDGLRFDIDNMTVATIRDDMEYGGIRLRAAAYLERTRIPLVVDIGFGDALPVPPGELDYPTLLDMEVPRIRSYPPATVIAEKFQAMVALGIGNGRMKDYYDLWALPCVVGSITLKGVELSLQVPVSRRKSRRGTFRGTRLESSN